jgi:hypothetical protein
MGRCYHHSSSNARVGFGRARGSTNLEWIDRDAQVPVDLVRCRALHRPRSR